MLNEFYSPIITTQFSLYSACIQPNKLYFSIYPHHIMIPSLSELILYRMSPLTNNIDFIFIYYIKVNNIYFYFFY